MKQHFHEQLLWTSEGEICAKEVFFKKSCRLRIDPLAEAGVGDGLVNGEPGGRAEVLLGGGQRATPRYLKPRSGGAEVVG